MLVRSLLSASSTGYRTDLSSSTSVHDNMFHDMYEPQGSVHGNIWNLNNDGLVDLGQPEFYNNVFYNINEGVGVWFQQNPVGYYFNNVSWNNSNSANCLRIGGSNVSTMQPVTKMYIYNNTWDAPCTVRGTAPSPGGDPAQNGPVYFENNHLIGFGITGFGSGNGTLYSCDSGAICGWTDNGNELFQTESVANQEGYTKANYYAPTPGGATIGAGGDASNWCPTFSSDSELCGGTSDGVSEKAGEGGRVRPGPRNSNGAAPNHVGCRGLQVRERPSAKSADGVGGSRSLIPIFFLASLRCRTEAAASNCCYD